MPSALDLSMHSIADVDSLAIVVLIALFRRLHGRQRVSLYRLRLFRFFFSNSVPAYCFSFIVSRLAWYVGTLLKFGVVIIPMRDRLVITDARFHAHILILLVSSQQSIFLTKWNDHGIYFLLGTMALASFSSSFLENFIVYIHYHDYSLIGTSHYHISQYISLFHLYLGLSGSLSFSTKSTLFNRRCNH